MKTGNGDHLIQELFSLLATGLPVAALHECTVPRCASFPRFPLFPPDEGTIAPWVTFYKREHDQLTKGPFCTMMGTPSIQNRNEVRRCRKKLL